jgi:hypothetical protein
MTKKNKYYTLNRDGSIDSISYKKYLSSKNQCLFFNGFVNSWIFVDKTYGHNKDGSPKKIDILYTKRMGELRC